MASVTLTESAKLALDDLVAGVIENVITINQMYEILPFDGIDGNSLAYNRENVLGDVQMLGVGGTITAKNAATFTKVNSNLTSIIGDAEVNGLIQATRSAETNQEAQQIASKAKSAGRQYQSQLINGSNLTFELMDALLDLVIDKDGLVDYMAFPARTIRAYKSLLRGLGGTSVDDVYELPSGARVIAYSNVPIFRNDYIPVNQTQGSSSNTTTLFAGTLDDGSRTIGIAGLTAANEAGIVVEDVGIHQSRDETITRVKWYCGLANFNEKGLASIPGIKN